MRLFEPITIRGMEIRNRIVYPAINMIMGMTNRRARAYYTQAREKLYQDLLDKGDLEGAKAMRAYQDIVHSLKDGDQDPPSSPSRPPSPA